MKLVVWKGSNHSNELVRVEWQNGDSGCAWLSTGWAPTEEDHVPGRSGFTGGEYGFSKMAASFVPDDCMVCAKIYGEILSETKIMIQDLQELGLRFERPSVMKSIRKRSWKNIFEGDVLSVEANRDFVSYCFEKYGSWMSSSWTFLVSRTPLTDWVQQLRHVSRRRIITKDFLQQIELFFLNRWEHGFEVLSCKHNYDQLKEMARVAAKNLNWVFVEAPDSSNETLRGLQVW